MCPHCLLVILISIVSALAGIFPFLRAYVTKLHRCTPKCDDECHCKKVDVSKDLHREVEA